jgi:hypothetical protein
MATQKPARKTNQPPAKTPAAKKAAQKNQTQTQADVTVRMFCQGLGDCFLITIPQADVRPYSRPCQLVERLV